MNIDYKKGWDDAIKMMQQLLFDKYGDLFNKKHDDLSFPKIIAKDFARDIQGKIAILKTTDNKTLNPTQTQAHVSKGGK